MQKFLQYQVIHSQQNIKTRFWL